MTNRLTKRKEKRRKRTTTPERATSQSSFSQEKLVFPLFDCGGYFTGSHLHCCGRVGVFINWCNDVTLLPICFEEEFRLGRALILCVLLAVRNSA